MTPRIAARLAGAGNQPYFMAAADGATDRPRIRMSEALASNRLALLIAAGVAGAAVAAAAALWAHYGTAVFFEAIRAGFVACFG
jgi:hypothetical protein